jgi:XTP/dITP diphosphohydrolase
VKKILETSLILTKKGLSAKSTQNIEKCPSCETGLLGAFCHQCGWPAADPERAFMRLVGIMDDLREKCPWDQKQTIETLRPLTIEETYELADAIISEDWNSIREELGDLMLHLVFYSKIASEKQAFKLEDMLNAVCEKLIHRHPHIYGDVQVRNEEEVKQNWEKLKLREGKKSILAGVPDGLPSMVKAIRLQEKAKQVGFEWEHKEQVWEKVEEELLEFKNDLVAGNHTKTTEELGDLFFSLINYARFLGIDADYALELTNRKFRQRFMAMEDIAEAKGQKLYDMTLQEMDEIWNHVKNNQP